MKFDGSPESWIPFYQLFVKLIDENKNLSDLEKVNYLVTHLSGSAKSIITGIPPSEANYRLLLETLVNRFEDKRALGNYYLDKIVNFKPVTQESEKGLNSFLEGFVEAAVGITKLGIGDLFDFFLVNAACKKLDSETIRYFDMAVRDEAIPKFQKLVDFVRAQAKILARAGKPASCSAGKGVGKSPQVFVAQQPIPSALALKDQACPLCKFNPAHPWYKCSAFLQMTAKQRHEQVKKARRCFNCLSQSHQAVRCPSKFNCSHCKGRHHGLLHFEEGGYANNQPSVTATPSSPPLVAAISGSTSLDHIPAPTVVSNVCRHSLVLLSTAQVVVVNRTVGQPFLLRALLDGGSQANFIRKEACARLGLLTTPTKSQVTCLAQGIAPITEKAMVSFCSRLNPQNKFDIEALVLEEITDTLPSKTIALEDLSHLSGLELADQRFNIPGPIDLLIGAALWPIIVGGRKIVGPMNGPVAIEPSLGWLVTGEVPIKTSAPPVPKAFNVCLEDERLDDVMSKFWALEEVPTAIKPSPEDDFCEEHFLNTVSRASDGRFIVSLPFRRPPSLLGESLSSATRRFLSMERRLLTDPKMHEQYVEVMKGYIEKGYMSQVPYDQTQGDGYAYYIPHHGVVKPSSTSTPLRVVLDASAKSSSGYSLNDLLHAGPKLQTDFVSILLNFRLFRFALSADIKQMYQRIFVNDGDRCYQRLVWRSSPQEELRVYHMTTVVFGMSCSPYLAQRAVRCLVEMEGVNFPQAVGTAQRDLYMDDLLTSLPSESEALETRRELLALFKRGSFRLTKWSTNSSRVWSDIPEEDRSVELLSFDKEHYLKVLGLRWEPFRDEFSVHINTSSQGTQCTKRAMLSTIARIFDPLGFFGPVTIVVKGLIRTLWELKIDWDEVPPLEICRLWEDFSRDLPRLSDVRIPRHLAVEPDNHTLLIGFADASMSAYGAVVYVRTSNAQNTTIRFVCAKSKVSPVKCVSIPRLELCAALLLSKLLRYVHETLAVRHPIAGVRAFSDSTVALQWLSSSPSRWSVFVGNRVTQIQENVAVHDWFHVSGQMNPADCLSRGLSPGAFLSHPLWLDGPPWTCSAEETWPVKRASELVGEVTPPEEKIQTCVVSVPDKEWVFDPLLDRISSYRRLIRATVLIRRAFRSREVRSGPLRASELERAERDWCRRVQRMCLGDIVSELERTASRPHTSERKLHPLILKLGLFLEEGIVRVGGRLQNSGLSYERRHPILLPKKGRFVELLVDQYHQDNLHTGAHLLLSLVHLRFWIISARELVRRRVKSCNWCFRMRPKALQPKMAPLPSARFHELKAFVNCGVDYAGPFSIHITRRRGAKSVKAYICLFVCLATKAIHLELASELTTNCFLAAFRRFLSRRGPCSLICSDQGTNFVGAKNSLDELYRLLVSSDYNKAIVSELANRRIEWRLNPPAAPHFGGIWEANVKSVKTHLKKLTGNTLLTYEEFNTALVQIEALLNSRPLAALDRSDGDHPEALTPAHFLTLGPSLDYLPAIDVSSLQIPRLEHYAKVNWVVQQLWIRWRQEYLYTLQNRAKWQRDCPPIRPGMVVVMMKDNAPPLQWPLAVVLEVYPGPDGVERVAKVKVNGGELIRPLVKLCPLPTQ